jgi:1,4-alpha-glucan branching enzyme
LAFLRYGAEGDPKPVLVVCNLTPTPRTGYRIGVPTAGKWRERLNTDAEIYGGSNLGNGGQLETQAVPSHGYEVSLQLTLPPLATLLLQPE